MVIDEKIYQNKIYFYKLAIALPILLFILFRIVQYRILEFEDVKSRLVAVFIFESIICINIIILCNNIYKIFYLSVRGDKMRCMNILFSI